MRPGGRGEAAHRGSQKTEMEEILTGTRPNLSLSCLGKQTQIGEVTRLRCHGALVAESAGSPDFCCSILPAALSQTQRGENEERDYFLGYAEKERREHRHREQGARRDLPCYWEAQAPSAAGLSASVSLDSCRWNQVDSLPT